MKRFLVLLVFSAGLPSAAASAEYDEPLSILERYAADYTHDPNARDVVFGVKVDEGWYTINASGDEVRARRGQPNSRALPPCSVTPIGHLQARRNANVSGMRGLTKTSGSLWVR